jgi:hypothetical protein
MTFAAYLVLWAGVGLWWTCEYVHAVDDISFRHVFWGGPVLWLFALCVLLWIFCLGIHAAVLDINAAITVWSLRPVDRAVNQYQIGGCHE